MPANISIGALRIVVPITKHPLELNPVDELDEDEDEDEDDEEDEDGDY